MARVRMLSMLKAPRASSSRMTTRIIGATATAPSERVDLPILGIGDRLAALLPAARSMRQHEAGHGLRPR